ncbi:hypothetical protein, partial [Neisseria mucosa]|uniref:hypothetical protein n=1 Tax=Neisseria mucosa TaxID=488 RepID=UPI0019816895
VLSAASSPCPDLNLIYYNLAIARLWVGKFEKIRERVESWKSKGRLKNRNAWFSDDLCFGKTAQRVTLRQSLSK